MDPDVKPSVALKALFVQMIDEHKNKLIDPVAMLNWTHLRVFLNEMRIEDFERHLQNAERVLSQ